MFYKISESELSKCSEFYELTDTYTKSGIGSFPYDIVEKSAVNFFLNFIYELTDSFSSLLDC